MGSALPLGDPAPASGELPADTADHSSGRNFGVYVHVPFCRVRCGYCDFNTYTATELRGAKQSDYASEAVAEMRFARDVLDRTGLADRPISTVFFGGGTPTLLPASDLAAMLDGVRSLSHLAPDAEITTEANPDSVDREYLDTLVKAGFTRVSFGMQSAVPHVLKTLDRTHDPERVPLVVDWAKQAGLDVSLDLIYGTPGESLADWQLSLESAIACEPNHISAYALIVEEGTKLAREIKRGIVATPDDDLEADMYELADELLGRAGFSWYEVSNFARSPEHVSRHNLAYWQGHDWWGFGPGAHSYVGNTRWWNVKHPAAYAARIAEGTSPAAGRETLDASLRDLERVLLRSRLAEGLPVAEIPQAVRHEVAGLIADELIDPRRALSGTVVLTLRGRLLADAVVRRLTE